MTQTTRGPLGLSMKVTEVAENTCILDCSEDVGFSLSEVAYLLTGDSPVLIEPGSTTTASRLLAASKDAGIDFNRLSYIIPTHIHVDHGGGAGYLARHLPHVKVVLHPRGAKNMADPARLVAATKLVFGDDFEQRFGPIMPIPERQMHVVQDNEVLRAGGRDLTVLFTPGHASHHISVYDRLTQGVFPGEALGFIATSMPDFPLPAAVPPFDLPLYIQSIDRLADLAPGVAFYSHCGPRSDPKHLIRAIRRTSIEIGRIVEMAVREGKKEEQIWTLISDYVRMSTNGGELPPEFLLGLSAYVSYFRRT
ncbi:MAG: MBL fold metallo-hydrolase [Dehalococcoidia bacterium]|nr:MBL fold metallo-hydrolase [Dehalococcoidia bacterium]